MNLNIDISDHRKAKYAKNKFKITKEVKNYTKRTKLTTIRLYFLKVIITINIGNVDLWYY